MYRTARRSILSGIATIRVPRGGWHREDPGDTGEGRGPGHDNTGEDDTGKAGDNDSTESKAPKTYLVEVARTATHRR